MAAMMIQQGYRAYDMYLGRALDLRNHVERPVMWFVLADQMSGQL